MLDRWVSGSDQNLEEDQADGMRAAIMKLMAEPGGEEEYAAWRKARPAIRMGMVSR